MVNLIAAGYDVVSSTVVPRVPIMNLRDPERTESSDLEESQIHNVLRNDRRRRTIKHLRETDGTMTVDELAEHIATLETGESPAPRKVRKSVYVSLHQTHLPKLDDLGIVEYDQRSKELTLQERAKEVEVYMEVVAPSDVSWATYYLGLGLLELVALLATSLDLFTIELLNFSFWTWTFLVFFLASAGYHIYSHREKTLAP